MNLPMPIYGHHVEDITLYLDAEHQERLAALKAMVEESKAHQLTGFIGGPPCPDFSVAGKIEVEMVIMVVFPVRMLV